MKIKLDRILIHPDLQARVTMNEEMIGTLIPIYEKIKQGEYVWTQNIVIFRDTTTKNFYLIDGHHRLEAMKRAGLTETNAEVPTNIHTIEDALLRSLSVNSTHGENFRPADIRRAVELLLKYQPEMTVDRICFHLHRGKSVIYQYVRELSSSGKLNLPETRVGKDGKKRPTKYTDREETALVQKKKPVLLKLANVQQPKAETKVKRCPHCGGILD